VRYLGIEGIPRVSKVGLGTWQFGAREWGYGDRYAQEEALRIVERALELGVTLFDTAEIYALGRSERILGRALHGRREGVFVATKFFPILPFAARVRRSAFASARRLGVERLDLYQVHQPNPFVRDGGMMRGMRSLQESGVVGEVGVSN
jgi:aryl-alcohol dehydrogenase-like predicted oxidoreductase